jgi:hypothetical protein
MRLIPVLLALAVGGLLAGCGGGGIGGGAPNVTLTGVVRWLPTAGPPEPNATVQAGAATAATRAEDGSFQISVPSGTSSVLVVHQPPAGEAVSFRFDFPAATLNPTDVGDLWIGPAKVRVAGRTLSAADDSPVVGALIEFAGKRAVTGADGRFTLTDVAYDAGSLATFTSVVGRASRTGFITRTFSPVSGEAGGVVTLDTIFMPPDSGGQPPGTPFNLLGTVSPSAQAPGTVVTLTRAGAPVRRMTVGPDRQYGFWVTAGAHQLQFVNQAHGLGAGPIDVTITDPSRILRLDVTLR